MNTFLLVIGLVAIAGLGMVFARRDVLLEVTKALPNGAATTVSDGIDLGLSSRSDFLANGEFVISAPLLTTAQLPDTKTITYAIYHDDAVAFGTEALLATLLVQTGAGGAGAAAATATLRPPTSIKRYVRLKATNSGTGDASPTSVTLSLRT